MTTDPLPELALTDQEVDEVLRHCDGQALLVGGQALAFWAQYYRIKPHGDLAVVVTSDADFVGAARVARAIAAALKPAGWRYWQPSPEDATSQTAKLSKRIEGLGIKQIDFLDRIVGLKTEGIQRRAVALELADGARLRVLHPLDVLESRLKNLAELPSKRNSHGIAQARLALEVTGCLLDQLLREENARRLLDAIERIFLIARQKGLQDVFHDYGIDVLGIVPADRIPSEVFRKKRWPQILAHVAQQRRSYAQHRRGRPESPHGR
ncbi:MAG: hypothetical protein KGL45_01795 [Gammaproteobacteria bacterium]|nr:hypothetical protein [Gammaproteobacteria bacterium]MDE2261236.1 hypothetical protein [Gammaproteobacteria bacterium]